MRLFAALFASCFATITCGSISDNFRLFLRESYGPEIEALIARDDVGQNGALGGGNHLARTKTRKLPVIFVHGAGGTAGQALDSIAYFRERGYGDEELYATTYGIDRKTDSMRCAFVKQVRSLIVAVSNYTDSPVKVVAFSMGGPISRKAILGGKCVDTDEDLGPPLTNTVRSYLTVGGPNRGAAFCLDRVDDDVCNLVNGMHCKSKFIKDINERSGYEGQRIYAIQSKADEVVGFEICGEKVTQLPHSRLVFTVDSFNHADILGRTTAVQYNLISND